MYVKKVFVTDFTIVVQSKHSCSESLCMDIGQKKTCTESGRHVTSPNEGFPQWSFLPEDQNLGTRLSDCQNVIYGAIHRQVVKQGF